MKTLKRILLLACLITVSSCQADTPKPPPADWKTECVGRYQVSLPGEVEVALILKQAMTDRRINNAFRFRDGSDAPYSASDDVSEMEDKAAFRIFEEEFDAERLSVKNNLIKDSKPERSGYINKVKLSVNNAFGWTGEDFVDLYFYGDKHFFHFREMEPKRAAFIRDIQQNFHPRALYELPTQTGVCFPYGFIADEGKTPYNTAVTMRLLAHPDVEIMVSFQIADHNGQGNNPKLMHNYLHQRLEEFWGRRNYTGMYKKINISSTKSIMLDGREGAGIFANYQNYTKTDTLPVNAYGHRVYNSRDDFGLYASAEGEEGNPAKPTITVYVIRTADRAKGEPVTEAELKAMAETIIASIKPMTAK
jgi:hypothetical protein